MKTWMKILAGLAVLAGAGLWWAAAHLAPDVEVGTACPDVTLEGLDGEPIALSELRGRPVLLDFWSST